MKHTLLVLTLLPLLTGCPSKSDSNTLNNTGSEPGHPLQFQANQVLCCWDDLLTAARAKGVNYTELFSQAQQGDSTALEKLLVFSKNLDLQLSFPHAAALVSLLYIRGDQAFAQALKHLSEQGELKQEHPVFQETLKETLRNLLESGNQFQQNPQLTTFSLNRYQAVAAELGYTLQTGQ
jgi:hypothetical protein